MWFHSLLSRSTERKYEVEWNGVEWNGMEWFHSIPLHPKTEHILREIHDERCTLSLKTQVSACYQRRPDYPSPPVTCSCISQFFPRTGAQLARNPIPLASAYETSYACTFSHLIFTHKFWRNQNIFYVPCKKIQISVLQHDYSRDVYFYLFYMGHIKCSLFNEKTMCAWNVKMHTRSFLKDFFNIMKK
jgi:hypothetical protein